MTDLFELRKLAEAATAGPWIAGDDEDSDYFLVGPHDGDEIVFRPVVKLHAQNNALFIAEANPAAVISLIDQIELLQVQLEPAKQKTGEENKFWNGATSKNRKMAFLSVCKGCNELKYADPIEQLIETSQNLGLYDK